MKCIISFGLQSFTNQHQCVLSVELSANVQAVSFDCFFAVLVLLNCAFIGIEVQHAIEQPDSTPVEFYVVQCLGKQQASPFDYCLLCVPV